MVTTKKLLSSQLRINMVSGTVTTVINTITMAVGFPIYLHFLGYEKYGVWLVLATVLSFAQLGDLGIGQAITKLVAEEYGRNNIEGIQHYVTTALASLCISGTVALIVIVIFKSQITAIFKLSSDNATMVSSLLPYIAALSIYVFIVQVLGSTLSGLGRMDLANYIQALSRLVGVTAAGVLLYRGLGVVGLLIGNALSYVFVHIASLICIWRIARIRLLRINNLDAQRCKRLLLFGGGLVGGNIVNMLGSPFNKLMLSRYAGISTIPIYEIAFNGAMQIRSIIEASFRALMPEISRININITRYAKDKISQLNRSAMKLIIVFGVPLYIVMLIFATPLLKIWLRQGFVQTIPFVFRIMLIANFANLLAVPSYYFLMGMGRIKNIFIARCITWLTSMTLVTMIAVNTNYLSVSILGLCLFVSWSLSSAYLIWLFRSAMWNYERIVSSSEKLKSNTLIRCAEPVS